MCGSQVSLNDCLPSWGGQKGIARTWSIHRAFSMQANLNRENMLFRWHVPVIFVHDGKSAMNAPPLEFE